MTAVQLSGPVDPAYAAALFVTGYLVLFATSRTALHRWAARRNRRRHRHGSNT